MNNDKVNMDGLLIQIETAAREMFQMETSQSAIIPGEVNLVFKEIARGLIGKNSTSIAATFTQTENHNANAAKADIKG
jgi:hypothetical protein